MPITPICWGCKNFDRVEHACKAFPKGIPEEILTGQNDHSKPLPKQDNDIVFEPREEKK